MTFALDGLDREAISRAATAGDHSGDVVRDVLLAAVEQCFRTVPTGAAPIEWLSDNGSAYIDHGTRSFARELGLEPLTILVCSPQSIGMAESFVKTIQHDYSALLTSLMCRQRSRIWLAPFEHYNERNPHKALKSRCPREFRRTAALST